VCVSVGRGCSFISKPGGDAASPALVFAGHGGIEVPYIGRLRHMSEAPTAARWGRGDKDKKTAQHASFRSTHFGKGGDIVSESHKLTTDPEKTLSRDVQLRKHRGRSTRPLSVRGARAPPRKEFGAPRPVGLSLTSESSLRVKRKNGSPFGEGSKATLPRSWGTTRLDEVS